MNTDLTALCRRLLHNVQHDQTDLGEAVHREAASHFLDAERHQREREQFFLQTPQVVGFAGELAEPNSYKAVTILERPVLITRDDDGVLRAFINACQHRGAQIAQGEGCKEALSCPFHGWTYGLDGKLVGRRQEHAFISTDRNNRIDSKEEIGLTALPISDKSGLLTVGATPNVTQAQVDTFLDDISSELSGFDFTAMRSLATRRFEVKANWKLVVNLSNEGYHFENLHRDSLVPMMSSHGVVDYCGQHSRWAFALKSILELAELDEAQWPEHFPGSVNHTLFPGTVVVATPQSAQIIRSEPGPTPGQSVVHFSGVYQSHSYQSKNDASNDAKWRDAFTSAFEFGESIFVGEDLVAAEQCQRGIEAGGLRDVISGRNEPLVSFWQKLWNERLDSKG
ncbi:MAG: aromatic ring-hydroxylating dioxygenase subunit alpha [Pseudomonadales bacterium]